MDFLGGATGKAGGGEGGEVLLHCPLAGNTRRLFEIFSII